MKRFFSINRRLVEILLSLVLVVIAAGYYYLIYIPSREDEIIARRFRTLQRIEKNIQEKYQGYIATVKNCLSQADDQDFGKLVDRYNSEKDKFSIRIAKSEKLTPVDTSIWIVKTKIRKGKPSGKTDTTRASSDEKFNRKQYDSAFSF